MVDVGEVVVGTVLLASALALVYAVDFNKTINKTKGKNMDNKTKLRECWGQFLIAREVQSELPAHDDKGLTHLEFAMLCHIAHQDGNANITSIVRHPYFAVASLSTVKRAVSRLISEDLIYATDTSQDKRERMLSLVDRG